MVHVLVVGPPRSGTTWIGQTLGRATGARYVHEPDGDHEVYALKVKRGAPRHLELTLDEPAAGYESLWDGAFAGGLHGRGPRARAVEWLFDSTPLPDRTEARRGGRVRPRLRLALALARPLEADASARHVVAKSVHACLAAGWIAARFDPRVVVVGRNPLNVLASWDELGQGVDRVEYAQLGDVARRRWGIELPGPDAPRIARQAAFFGVLQGALGEAADRHPEWVRVLHDDLLVDPPDRFRALCAEVGLEYSDASAEYLAQSNRPGEGYVTRRVTGALARRWRERLSAVQVADALDALRAFPPHLGLLASVGEDVP